MSLPLLLVPLATALAVPVAQAGTVTPPVSLPVTLADPPAHPVRTNRVKGDPLEKFNRRMFRLFTGLDHAAIRPAAMGYKHVVPELVRSGLRNLFRNLTEPVVFANYLLQLKPGKAAETFARFAVNASVGVGGLADVAKQRPFNLPHRPNGFGDTLGFYGVKPGPYLFLPIIGPTTLRDLIGVQADGALLPATVGKPFNRAAFLIPQAVITGLDTRAESDDDLRALYGQAVDPYATLRSSYLQDRQGEIDALHGRRADKTKSGSDSSSGNPGANADPLRDPLTDPASSQQPRPVQADSTSTDPQSSPIGKSPQTLPKPSPTPPERQRTSDAAELSDPLTDPATPVPTPKPPSG